MLLPVQIQSILYHILTGWIYALGASFIISFIKFIHFPFIKGVLEIVYHLCFTTLMFYGLYHINGGITNIYLIGFFLLGVIIYYSCYLRVFLELFSNIRRFLHPWKIKISIVKSKIVDIIKLPSKIRRRRKKRGKSKRKQKKEKKKTSNKAPD